MKKIFFILPVFFFCILWATPLWAGNMYAALGAGYHSKSDPYYEKVYGEGTVNTTLDLGVRVSGNLALGIKVSYFAKQGETLLFQEEARLRQIPAAVYAKAFIPMGKKFRGYASLGTAYLFYKEESYIGRITDGHFGWEIEGGLEYLLGKNLYLLSALRHQSFRVSFADIEETQQLGGTDLRLGIGVTF